MGRKPLCRGFLPIFCAQAAYSVPLLHSFCPAVWDDLQNMLTFVAVKAKGCPSIWNGLRKDPQT